MSLPWLSVPALLPSPTPRAAAALLHRLGWTQVGREDRAGRHLLQVAVLAGEEVGRQLGAALARRRICVLDLGELPGRKAGQDQYTSLLRGLREAGLHSVLVTGLGADIQRLARKMFELNLAVRMVALPWDGSVPGMPSSDTQNVPIFQVASAQALLLLLPCCCCYYCCCCC